MYSARQLILNIDDESLPNRSSLKLIVDRMSRLFIYSENKFFSISFPFLISEEEGSIVITTYSGNLIDNKVISAVLSILEDENYIEKKSLIDFYIEPNSIESSGIFILEELMQNEPGYVRYDNDPENENGELHPLNHIDINFSQYGKLKLGLTSQINSEYFENLHNTNTNCAFLK